MSPLNLCLKKHTKASCSLSTIRGFFGIIVFVLWRLTKGVIEPEMLLTSDKEEELLWKNVMHPVLWGCWEALFFFRNRASKQTTKSNLDLIWRIQVGRNWIRAEKNQTTEEGASRTNNSFERNKQTINVKKFGSQRDFFPFVSVENLIKKNGCFTDVPTHFLFLQHHLVEKPVL